MRFEDIISHENIIRDLNRGIKNDEISHAILFDGIGGIGKKYTAKQLAKSLLCSNKKGCNYCPSCRQFDSGSNPDYLFVTKDGNSIKKEQIQEVIEFLSIKPFESKYKVVILEHFHTATVEAQNSMLKTLEEPSSYGKIILLSENSNNLLETIVSRTKVYKFYPIPKLILIRYLIDRFGISEDEASFYADYSGGSIGQAIKYLEDSNFKSERTQALKILDKAIKSQRSYVLNNLDYFNKDNIEEVIDLYLIWARDLKIYKQSHNLKNLYNKEYINQISSQMYLTDEVIDYIINKILEVKKNINYNISPEFVMEMFFIDIMEECKWIE